ncbi:ABC-three component system middle component 6 [Pseudaeromonas sharmana]|jgi:hypothetical protein|uniref:ABC-three component system middle component 6 n=1 Tax=Pseudaeromonas sharmana TaxID=328412 RepID=A0ABV8CRF4_9GAMM
MLTIDSDPTINPVNIGAFIILIMNDMTHIDISISSLYEITKNEFNLSYDVFVYTLDWLYVIGVIELNDRGNIQYATK